MAESYAGLPRHFAEGGDLIQSHFIAAMSAVFPEGEDFFIRSVRPYRDQITDPVLKRQVAGFIGQETMHGREHRAFNERLEEVGYRVKRVERMTKRGLGLQFKLFSPIANLAHTVAVEHVTATLAETFMNDEQFRKSFGHAEGLFSWHALEESEHKAVAFDVYRAVGGSERLRIRTMKAVRWGITVTSFVQILMSLLGDRATYRPGNLRSSWRRFRRSSLISRATWGRLKDFERSDFHPNDWDASQVIEEWTDRLFGDSGELKDRLVGSVP